MVHDCTDWSTTPPTRKTTFLILGYGDSYFYVAIPRTFEDLVEVARKKFNLGNVDLGFHSSCANLCGDFAVKIDKDAWEQVAPYIGCLIITSSNHANEVPFQTRPSDDPSVMTDGQLHPMEVVTSPDNFGIEGVESSFEEVRESDFTVLVGADIVGEQDSQGPPTDAITPLRTSPDRWIATSIHIQHRPPMISHTPAQTKRRFTGLLNKLTRSNVYLICDRILSWIKECVPSVQPEVLKMVSRLLFDRAVDEPERMGTYMSLCEIIIKISHSKVRNLDSDVMKGYLSQWWEKAFDQGNLSWGETIEDAPRAQGPKKIPVEEYYTMERQKRRGIGLAGLKVELLGLNTFTQRDRVYSKTYLVQLMDNVKKSAREGDIISLCILMRAGNVLQSVCREFAWQADYPWEFPSSIKKLLKYKFLSGRIRSQLLDLSDMTNAQSRSNYLRRTAYNALHNGFRYSVPDAARMCASRFFIFPDLHIVDVDCSDHYWLIRSFVVSAVEKNEYLAPKARKFLSGIVQRGLYSAGDLEVGFSFVADVLDVIASISRQAYRHMGALMKDAGFYKEEERLMRIVQRVRRSEELFSLVLWAPAAEF